MHEMGIMENVLRAALSVAEQNGGSRVTGITLRAGVMSGLIPRYCRTMLEFLSKDTPAESCELCFEEEPAVFKCEDCGAETRCDAIPTDYLCSACGSRRLKLTSGYTAQIVSVAIV